MTTEQLNQARAEAWRQACNPLLTLDDAAAWLDETAICLFLPRVQIATATPSFVEAVLGASDATPSQEAIETATEMLHRLLGSGNAVALNLLGTPGEQPDFLATTETLPFIFALLGDKEWKRGPRGKSSPLVIEVWKLLDREGPLTTIEVKDKLGRQLTEAAALRALTELWSHLRIEPGFKNGQPAAWQLLERSRLEQMQAGSSMSQAVALSALISLYLQSAVAASLEEVEVFLSPLASRSKVREVVKGLTATRQLSTLNLGPVEMYHVEGSLPEFPEIGRLEGVVLDTRGEAPAGPEAGAGMGEGRRRFVAQRLAAEAGEAGAAQGIGHASERTPRPAERASRPPTREAGRREVRRPSRGDQGEGSSDRRPFSPRPGTTGGERRPYGTRSPSGAGSFNPREPWKEDRKPAAPRGEGAEQRPFAKTRDEGQAPGERRPFQPRESSGRKPFAPRTGDQPFQPRAGARPLGERKPFASRESGERKPFTPGEGGPGERKPFTPPSKDRPFRPRSDSQTFGERKSPADRKPFSPRKGDDRKPFAPGAGAERKKFGDRKPSDPRTHESGERTPFKPRSNSKPFAERKPFGERKPFAPRSGGDQKPFPPREGGERRPFPPREGERNSFASRFGERPFKPRVGGKPFGEGGGFGGRRPFVPRESRPPGQRESGPGESRPTRPGTGARPFKPRSDSRPGGPASRGSGDRPVQRSSFGAARPAGPGARTSFGARKTTGAARARTSPMTSSGKPRSGVKPPTGRPGPRATRGGAAGARGGVKRTGRPGKGRSK